MAVSMKLTVNSKETEALLQKVAGKVDNFQTPLKQSGVYMEGAIGRRFSHTSSWAPLSPATIRRHPHRAGGRVLNDTGRLRASVTSGATKQLSPTVLRYGTSLVYAPLHNFGGQTRFGYVPKREFLYFNAKDNKMIRQIFVKYIEGLI